MAQAKDSGAALGGYHFGDHRYDPHEQARFFFDRAEALGLLDAGDLAPMYDVENWGTKTLQVTWPNRQTIRYHVNVWLDEAVRRGCRRALIYGSLSWWLGGMLVPADYERGDIEVLNWIAVYNGRPGDLQGWAHPRDALHQYTSDGTFDGIDGRVDKNKTLNGRTAAGLTIRGDDMLTPDDGNVIWKAKDPFTGNVEGHPVAEWGGLSAFYGLYANQKLDAAKVVQLEILNAVTGDDFDPVEALARMEKGAREGAERAVSTTVLPVLRDAMREVFGEDNEELVKAFLDGLGRRLAEGASS